MSTIKDIARLAGVAPSTVSEVLSNSISVKPETYERIMRAVRETHYQPNALARGLRTRETKTLGLILPTITNPHYPHIARGVEDFSNQSGYHVFLCNTERDAKKQTEYIQALASKNIDGIIFCNARIEEADAALLRSQNVALASTEETSAGEEIDEVKSDYRGVARQMVGYLLSLGHRRIALINGPEELSRCVERLRGFREAYDEAGCSPDPALVIHSDYTPEFAYLCTNRLLDQKRPPSAVFTTDYMAASVIYAAMDRGLRVPGDLSVAGIDNSVSIRPTLTTVNQSGYDMGRKLAEMVITRKQSREPLPKRVVTMPWNMVLGGSTGPHEE